MDPGITDIAAQLAAAIPTGSEDPAAATQDWRATIYNAKATASMRPLRDLISRSAPEDLEVEPLLDALDRK